MSRQRSMPWFRQWARPLMGGVAIVGVVETSYLTVVKLLGTSPACPSQGCDQVLSSPYATVLGVPLSLWGMVAYGLMAVFALGPLLVKEKPHKSWRTRLVRQTDWLLFGGATLMVVWSGYLMYILAFTLKAFCPYCFASAFLSGCLFGLALLERQWEDWGQVAFTGTLVGLIALTGIVGLEANPGGAMANAKSVETLEIPEITTQSGESELALAQHLQAVGAKMYGAWWCGHCAAQKQLFGKTAFNYVNYVECSDRETKSQLSVCQQAKIQGYPTWELNGEQRRGYQFLDELADWSGYQGPRSFQNLELLPQG